MICWKTESGLFEKKKSLRSKSKREELLKFVSSKESIHQFVKESISHTHNVPQCLVDLVLSCVIKFYLFFFILFFNFFIIFYYFLLFFIIFYFFIIMIIFFN